MSHITCPKACSLRNVGPIQHGQVVNEFEKCFILHNLTFPIHNHIFKTLRSATVSLLKFVAIFHGSSYFPWNTPLAQGVRDAAMSLFNWPFSAHKIPAYYAGFEYNGWPILIAKSQCFKIIYIYIHEDSYERNTCFILSNINWKNSFPWLQKFEFPKVVYPFLASMFSFLTKNNENKYNITQFPKEIIFLWYLRFRNSELKINMIFQIQSVWDGHII